MTVAAELVVALHHSRGVGPTVPHEASRGQTPASSGGRRPGVLKEPEPPVVCERTACPRSLGAHSLSLPSLADEAAEVVDASCLAFLVRRTFEDKKKVEEEKRKTKLQKDVAEAMDRARLSLEQAAKRRKRKKRRKRRTPRTSSRSLRGRARRRQRQWHACGVGSPGLPLRALFPSVSGRLVMLRVIFDMDQKGFFMFVDYHGSGMCRVGFTGYDAPRVMFPSGVAKPKMLRILTGMDQKDRCSGIYKAGIDGDNAPRAVFSSLVGRPRMLVILADMDQEESCSGMFKAGIAGYDAPRAVFSSLVRRPISDIYYAGISGDNALRAVFLGWQAHDVQHHGRYGPEGQLRHAAHVQTAQTVESPQLQSIQVVDFFFVVHPSCCTRWSTSLFPGRAGSLPRRGAEAGPWSKLFV